MSEGYQGSDLYSASVRAGKRTYFFDVKATRGNDLFLTITESKKVGFEEEGNVHYEKHKIFLYKEDFDNFMDALNVAMAEIKNKQGKDGFRSAESPRRSHSGALENEEGSHENNDDLTFDNLGGSESSTT
ncbi:MAG: DUF3276 family protein [Flavobacteriales bacterium]